MSAVVVDTHAILWYLLDSRRLSANASRALEEAASAGAPIYTPSIALIEMIYLVERGRIPYAAYQRVVTELRDGNTLLTLVPLDWEVIEALSTVEDEQIPEMPDRIVAATAVALDLPLITADARIRASSIKTIW
jgi:PIN domain nuclease of toxin-antitoxin system